MHLRYLVMVRRRSERIHALWATNAASGLRFLALPPVEPFGMRTSDRPDEIKASDQCKDDDTEIEGRIALARALFLRVARFGGSFRQPQHRRSPNSWSSSAQPRLWLVGATEETRDASEMFGRDST